MNHPTLSLDDIASVEEGAEGFRAIRISDGGAVYVPKTQPQSPFEDIVRNWLHDKAAKENA